MSWTGSVPVTPNDKPWGPGYPKLAPLASGGFVMLYWDSDFQDTWTLEPALRGQIYSADGAKLGNEFRIETVKDGNLHDYTVAGLPSGGFVVAFSQFSSPEGEEPGDDLWMQMYDASGSPIGDATQVNTLTHGGQGAAQIAVLASGGFVITWSDFGGNWPTQTGGVKAQLFDAGGDKVGGEFLVPPSVVLLQSSPAVTALPDGGFVITWEEDELGGEQSILAQRFDADGNRVGNSFEVVGPGDGYIFDPEVTVLADGRLAFTWTWTNGYNDPALRTARIEGQLLDVDGVKLGEIFIVSTELADDRRSSEVVALQDGGFAVTWEDSTGDGSGSAILAQIYDADAAKVDAAFLVNSPTEDDQRVPVTAVLAWGGIVTAWGDYGGVTPGNASTVALRIFTPGPIEARDDALLTDEATAIAGNLFADNGDGEDSVPADATLWVSAVDGAPAGVGEPIVLPSGALLTLNADGTFSYDPNGAFDHLAGYWTGGSNVAAEDSFTYSLAGGGSATVTVTVRGLPAPEHRILGTEGDDGLNGTADENLISGLGGNDLISAGEGDDLIDGGLGADSMTGGGGDDLYVVDNPGDQVIEVPGGGTDTVEAEIDYTLPAEVERLSLAGGALSGAGNALANILVGNAAANSLNGAAGADVMKGGAGDDLYVVDLVADAVVELAEQGTDTVRSSASYTLPDHVEHLTLSGGGNVGGSGNALANTITGNGGNNRLDGKAGADTMAGGKGHDLYVVGSATDRVVEGGSSGNDTVESAVSYRLPVHFEKLILTGGLGYDGTGNAGANTITGNSGGNILNGGSGNDAIDGGAGKDWLLGGAGVDSLKGGAGDDRFFFNVAAGAANADRILDFSAVDDSIYLLRSVFTRAGASGTLSASAFHQGSAAADAGDRIVYDAASGHIFYDRDGTGATAALLFATVTPGTPLTHADFVIYG